MSVLLQRSASAKSSLSFVFCFLLCYCFSLSLFLFYLSLLRVFSIFFLLFFFLLLLLLLFLLLLFQVKHFRPKAFKNTIFSDIFMPLEDKHTGFLQRFCRVKGEIVQKIVIYTGSFFCKCVENTVFCNVFSTRGFKCTANTMVFVIFYIQFSNQTSQQHWYLQGFDKANAKNTMFCNIFSQFFRSKNDHFLLYFCHCSSGLKKVLNWTKLLNCT